tara:strand:- start:968 stop:1405 length:438 start_codon:yes stop_codon:yes gene_type:complete
MDLLTTLYEQLEFLLDNKEKFTDNQILSISDRLIDKYQEEYGTEDEYENGNGNNYEDSYTTNIYELLEDYDYKNYYGFIKVKIMGENYKWCVGTNELYNLNLRQIGTFDYNYNYNSGYDLNYTTKIVFYGNPDKIFENCEVKYYY